MMETLDLTEKGEVIKSLQEIHHQLDNELKKEEPKKKKITQFMYEQMLKGLFLQIGNETDSQGRLIWK